MVLSSGAEENSSGAGKSVRGRGRGGVRQLNGGGGQKTKPKNFKHKSHLSKEPQKPKVFLLKLKYRYTNYQVLLFPYWCFERKEHCGSYKNKL
jgi:hypothetical protein